MTSRDRAIVAYDMLLSLMLKIELDSTAEFVEHFRTLLAETDRENFDDNGMMFTQVESAILSYFNGMEK